MTTLTRPTWLRPRDCTLALRKSGLQFVSPFNGTVQAIETLAERWAMQMTIPGASDGGPRSAFFNQWAGGVNHVALYHFGRPQPLGTLRGAPTLASATARGNTSLALAGCLGVNHLLNGSFETDSNADGLADHWGSYQAGATGSVSFGFYTSIVAHGSQLQRVTALSLGTTTGDVAGVYQTASATAMAGRAVTLSATVAAYDGTPAMRLVLTWRDGGGTIRQDEQVIAPTSTLTRRQLSVIAPAGATFVDAFVWMTQRSGTAGVAVCDIDAAQLEVGASATDFRPSATLLAGDMLGDGTQLYMVASDCTATDAGAMTVPVVNRCRGVVSGGTVVQWDRPTALFALPAMEQSTTWLRGGVVDAIALDVVEVY